MDACLRLDDDGTNLIVCRFVVVHSSFRELIVRIAETGSLIGPKQRCTLRGKLVGGKSILSYMALSIF